MTFNLKLVISHTKSGVYEEHSMIRKQNMFRWTLGYSGVSREEQVEARSSWMEQRV